MSLSNFELALLANRHSLKTWIDFLGRGAGDKCVPAGAPASIVPQVIDCMQEYRAEFRSISVFRIAPRVQLVVPSHNDKLDRFEYVGRTKPHISTHSSGGRAIALDSDSMLYFPARGQLYVHCSNALWRVISNSEAVSPHILETLVACAV